MPSCITLDRQSKGSGVLLAGRALDVDLALTQDSARKLASSGDGGRGDGDAAGGRDRRHLYLAKEGDIQPGSAAWLSMSEHDR
jgi:nucleolar protein 4